MREYLWPMSGISNAKFSSDLMWVVYLAMSVNLPACRALAIDMVGRLNSKGYLGPIIDPGRL